MCTWLSVPFLCTLFKEKHFKKIKLLSIDQVLSVQVIAFSSTNSLSIDQVKHVSELIIFSFMNF